MTELGGGVSIESLNDETDALTMEAWIQLEENNAHLSLMGTDHKYGLRTGDRAQFAFRSHGTPGAPPQQGAQHGFFLNLDSDHRTGIKMNHLALVRDPDQGEHRLYVNGQLMDHYPDAYRPTFKGFYLGSVKYQYGLKDGLGFLGYFEEVRISKSVRYTGEKFRPQIRFEPDADTLALYQCDEMKDGLLIDSSGNNHHGKVTGGKIETVNYEFAPDALAAMKASTPTPVTVPEDSKLAIAPFDTKQAEAYQELWAEELDEKVTSTNSIGMEFALIPPGKFLMGSQLDDPSHEPDEGPVEVTISKPFRLGIHEVTQYNWYQVMGTEPWRVNQTVPVGKEYAACYIGWNDAVEFCDRLTEVELKMKKLPEGYHYRLPTAAEWEMACRAGTTTRFSFGDDLSNADEYAWYSANTKDLNEPYAHEVGKKKPNAWGLHDMHGNVWEWCHDWHAGNLLGGIDPQGPDSSPRNLKVYRGGCWDEDFAKTGRSANQHRYFPVHKIPTLGFRIVLNKIAE